MNKKMNHLVQFTDDGIFHICKNGKLKTKGACKFAQWLDHHYYSARVISSSKKYKELKILKSCYQNISQGFPIVRLQKILQYNEGSEDTSENCIDSDDQKVTSDDSVQDPNYVDSESDSSSVENCFHDQLNEGSSSVEYGKVSGNKILQ